ncbi:DsbA family protein [Candidatus Woesearchaeota archaeon]|nr:DsbA family protein [Candidatus Woesearchaeota archaeon]
MENRRRIELELEHLNKTYKAGIIDDGEYDIAKQKLEQKLKSFIESTKKQEESKQIISEILEGKADTRPKKEARQDKGIKDLDKEVDKRNKRDLDLKNTIGYNNTEITIKNTDNHSREKEKTGKEREEKEKTSTEEDMLSRERKEKDADRKPSDSKERASKENKKQGKDSKERNFAAKDNKAKPKDKTGPLPQLEKSGKSNKNKKKREPRKKDSNIAYIIAFIALATVVIIVLLVLRGNDSGQIDIPKNLSNTEGVVIIDFYYSYSCKPCYETFNTLQDLKKIYKDRIIINYIHFPVDIDEDLLVDTAAECATDQNLSIVFSRMLFNAEKPLDMQGITELTEKTLMDQDSFIICIEGKEKLLQLTKQYRQGLEKGINTLPTIYINEEEVQGSKPKEFYEMIIDTQIGII